MSLNEVPSIAAPLAERTLGDIAVALPGATALFRASKLDYCCGGRRTLAEAAAAKSIDLDVIVADLERLGSTAVAAPAQLDTKALIETIVIRYHRVHGRELPELIRLAKRVEAVHRDHPSAPGGLADLLERIFGELTTHMQKEELILFPAMAKGGRAHFGHPRRRVDARERQNAALHHCAGGLLGA